jgi:hypothetical protein
MDGDEEEREKRTIPAGRAKPIRSFRFRRRNRF